MDHCSFDCVGANQILQYLANMKAESVAKNYVMAYV
jgi:hypothetical protein